MTPTKTKYPRAAAIEVARELVKVLQPHCERIIVAGSLRRKKPQVGDVEILYISKRLAIPELQQADMLAPSVAKFKLLADCWINWMAGYFHNPESDKTERRPKYILTQRRTIHGAITWGPKNKLAVHIATGIPVDLFRTTEESWWNYLVCRTGSAENNTRIASAAQQKGWKWNPYSPGFTDQEGNPVAVESEQDVFRLVGLPYLEPCDR